MSSQPQDLWTAAGAALKWQGQGPQPGPTPRPETLALSAAQARLWSLCQAEPDSVYYNIPFAWRVTGALRVDHLEEALNRVAQRHEILRSTFVMHAGHSAVRVAPSLKVPVIQEDLQNIPAEKREAEAFRKASLACRELFDLTFGPLLRVHLYRLQPEEYLFVLTIHQMIFDGGSLPIFMRDLAHGYRALAGESPAALPALPVQYADYGEWHNKILQEEALAEESAHWKSTLQDPYAPLLLPVDSRRKEGLTFPGETIFWEVSKQETEAIVRFARQEGQTPFAVLLAALQVLFFRYSGQTDVTVFCSMAARNRPEFRNLIGLFANILPFRTDLSGNPSFREALKRVREVSLDVFAHQMLPFQNALELLPRAPGTGNLPVCQVILIHHTVAVPTLTLPGARFTPHLGVETETAKLDLILDVAETREGIFGNVKYRRDLFEPETVRGILADFVGLLTKAAADPDGKISELPVDQGRAAKSAAGAAAAAAPDRASRERAAPRDDFERRLLAIWQEQMHLDEIGIHDDYFDLGGISLVAAQIFERINTEFGVRLRLGTLIECPTIAQLAEVIREGRKPVSALIPIRAKGKEFPVICLPGAFGNAIALKDLSDSIGSEFPVYSMEATESTPSESVEAIAGAFADAARSLQPKGPYYLVGLCFGALVCLEMARVLRHQGEEIGLLAVLDPPFPGSARTPPLSAYRKGLGPFLQRLKQAPLKDQIRGVGNGIQKVASLSRRIVSQRLSGIFRPFRPQVNPGASGSVALFHYNTQLAMRYSPQQYAGDCAVFIAEQNGYSVNQALEDSWRKLTGGNLAVVFIPGGHEDFFRPPHVQVMGERLTRVLRQARRQ